MSVSRIGFGIWYRPGGVGVDRFWLSGQVYMTARGKTQQWLHEPKRSYNITMVFSILFLMKWYTALLHIWEKKYSIVFWEHYSRHKDNLNFSLKSIANPQSTAEVVSTMEDIYQGRRKQQKDAEKHNSQKIPETRPRLHSSQRRIHWLVATKQHTCQYYMSHCASVAPLIAMLLCCHLVRVC